jgi:hypothetical protein
MKTPLKLNTSTWLFWLINPLSRLIKMNFIDMRIFFNTTYSVSKNNRQSYLSCFLHKHLILTNTVAKLNLFILSITSLHKIWNIVLIKLTQTDSDSVSYWNICRIYSDFADKKSLMFIGKIVDRMDTYLPTSHLQSMTQTSLPKWSLPNWRPF